MISRPWIPLALLLADLSLAAQAQESAGPAGLEIVFLDVGQGDAILLRSDTFAVLIDAGGSANTADQLEDAGVTHLHLAIASHNHRDHIGGMDEVISRLRVEHYLDNGCYGFSDTQDAVNQAIGDRDVQARTASDTVIQMGDMSLVIIPSPFQSFCDSSQNNLSIGVLVKVGSFRALLTGDSEVDELNGWLRDSVVPDVDLLKAAHHGSRNGVTPGWLLRTKPEVVVISVGVQNSYGHPAESALRYYRAGGRRVLRTDREGLIWICVEPGGTYEVSPRGGVNLFCG